jgi:hypothetical protein
MGEAHSSGVFVTADVNSPVVFEASLCGCPRPRHCLRQCCSCKSYTASATAGCRKMALVADGPQSCVGLAGCEQDVSVCVMFCRMRAFVLLWVFQIS